MILHDRSREPPGQHTGNVPPDVFLRSYIGSNRRFPQTRCYFVVDFSAQLGASHLASFLQKPVLAVTPLMDTLLQTANNSHARHHVPKSVDASMIGADINKMLLSLNESYQRFCSLLGMAEASQEFLQACTTVKSAIDQERLSADYLNFVSPPGISPSISMARIKVRNVFLEHRLHALFTSNRRLTAFQQTLLAAIAPEIVRPIWILRPLG